VSYVGGCSHGCGEKQEEQIVFVVPEDEIDDRLEGMLVTSVSYRGNIASSHRVRIMNVYTEKSLITGNPIKMLTVDPGNGRAYYHMSGRYWRPVLTDIQLIEWLARSK